MPCGHRASMEQRERERQTTLCPQHKHLSTSPSSSCLHISLVPGHFHFAKVSLSPRRRIYAVGVLHLFCGQNSFYFFTFIFAIFFSLPADRLASAIHTNKHTHIHTHTFHRTYKMCISSAQALSPVHSFGNVARPIEFGGHKSTSTR